MKNGTVCPKTCENKDHYKDCYLVAEGCSCPPGSILDFDVGYFSMFNFLDS